MRKGIFYITVLAGLILFWGGKPYHTIQATVQADTNLISNSNFTADTMPTDSGWVLSYQPDYPIFRKDAPPNDGLWSLGLVPSNMRLLENADYYITGISGIHNYTLSFWWKIANKSSFWVLTNGSVTVGVKKNDSILQAQTMVMPNQDTMWTQHTLNLSLNTQNSDTIIVRLCGGTAKESWHAVADGLFLFDDIQLTKQ